MLIKIVPRTELIDNVILLGPSNDQKFDYERFFGEQVDKKKNDHTYRVFKKVTRKGIQFPYAEEHTGEKRKITVWCSNDYLGMSWHPMVTKAVRYYQISCMDICSVVVFLIMFIPFLTIDCFKSIFLSNFYIKTQSCLTVVSNNLHIW